MEPHSAASSAVDHLRGSFDRSSGHYRDNVIVYAQAGN
jgi:hypothetical protein